MIDIGKNNVFLLGEHHLHSIYELFKYFDILQLSYIYFGNDNKHLFSCKLFKYSSIEELCTLILDNSFRLDLILIECNHDHKYVMNKIRDITDITIIMVTNSELCDDIHLYDSYHKFYGDRLSFIKTGIDMFENRDEYSFIEDLRTKQKSSIESLKLENVRDYKLNKILNK